MRTEILDLGFEQNQPPKAGDFFYFNGSWSTTLKQNRKCVGIVFFAGPGTNDEDASIYGFPKDENNENEYEIIGYVVALEDADYNGNTTGILGNASSNNVSGVAGYTNGNMYNGYTLTKAVINGSNNANYWAFHAADEYKDGAKPDYSSG